MTGSTVRWCAVAVCGVLAALGAAGCAQVGYYRIAIGKSTADQVKKALPGGATVNAYGYSYYDEAILADQRTAVAVILDDRKRAAAKVFTQATREHYWFAEVRRLQVLAEFAGASQSEGPAPVLQKMIERLRRRHPVREVQIASRLAAAGLVRVMEAMNAPPGTAAVQDLAEVLDNFPTEPGRIDAGYRDGKWRISFRSRQTIRKAAYQKQQPSKH